ncbi:MAG: DUF2887 domain-containing protein [bacterium]
MSSTHTRGTDDAFYNLMFIGAEAVLKLLGVKDPTGYEAKAVVLKGKEVRPDIMALPRGTGRESKERVYIEFQGYRSDMIRYSLASKVALSCAQERYTGPVLAGIIFTDSEYQEDALPFNLASLDGVFSIQGRFKEIVLTSYSEGQLMAIDSRLVVLAPFTVSRQLTKDDLMDRSRIWVDTAYKAYPKNLHQNVFNVLALFLLNRFRDLSREEVIQMLDFDLAQTRAGQDIFQEGREKGRLEGIEEGIEKGRLEGLIEAIKLGMELKFGLEGLTLLPRIEKEKDITRLDIIKEAIKIATSVKEIEKLLGSEP